MKKITIALALCSSAVSTAYAAESVKVDINNDALMKCKFEAKNDARLACYDNIFPPKAAEEAKPVVGVGKWQVLTKTSPIDDSENVFVSLSANDSFRSNFGESITPDLYITCREKKTELFINWDTYLGLNETQMLFRLDKQKAKTKRWDISSDTKAIFYRGNVIEFVKSLSQANVMFTQITPYNESPVNATFDLAGLSEALKPLQKACGWK
ncbi:type VI secretion protein [Izhakiella australiensis]|uniref:Type VI secretion protein n=1 Tax=Izhakiella australiensis TaxID=1926881 RepID=A0A1S8YHC7_9GAMM|nr:type VI secretion system-associated protein TagO [Izhakiella australiensis]OON38450.1 type VI secretion protein [Izhakiella australiensis]